MTSIKVIIPCFNEADSINKVIAEIPAVDEIIVVNNNSNDATEKKAKKEAVTVLFEKKRGYGYACLKGINYLKKQKKKPEIIVFIDGDYSDFPNQMNLLTQPIIEKKADFVLGARKAHLRDKGAMSPQQIWGNWLATTLMKIIYRSHFTDLGPFRAIRWDVLQKLQMKDKTYGWTVEMQLKILKKNFRYKEVPVNYRKRIGVSKISGTVKGTIFAGIKIIYWIFKYSFQK